MPTAGLALRESRVHLTKRSSASGGTNKFGDSEEPGESENVNFDISQLSKLSKIAPMPSQVDDTWKKLSKIYVLLFNARTSNEGICTIFQTHLKFLVSSMTPFIHSFTHACILLPMSSRQLHTSIPSPAFAAFSPEVSPRMISLQS
jgi:hypothetical protein